MGRDSKLELPHYLFGHVHHVGSLDGPHRGSVYLCHEHRRPPLPSLVAHLLKGGRCDLR